MWEPAITMNRKQVFIDCAMSQRLKQLAAKGGVWEAELIREAIKQRIASVEGDTEAWRQRFRQAVSLCDDSALPDRIAYDKAEQAAAMKKRLARNRQRLGQA
jgi:hypothetical protein